MKVACDDPDERPADAALIDALLGGLALKSTTSAFALLEELATRSATLPLVVPRVHAILLAVRSLIESAAIQQQQQQKSQQRRVDDALLDATRALLVRLAPLVTAPLVAGLFEQMLLLGRVASPNSAAAVAIDDATLARLVERMPQTTLLAAPAIEQALRVGGPLYDFKKRIIIILLSFCCCI